MGTNDTVKAILEMIDRLRAEQKATGEKIAGLEIAYEALTGSPAPNATTPATTTPVRVRKARSFKVDRQGSEKTLAFMQEREGKPTTVGQVARHFRIANGAATQRLLKLMRQGEVKRVSTGSYIPVATK